MEVEEEDRRLMSGNNVKIKDSSLKYSLKLIEVKVWTECGIYVFADFRSTTPCETRSSQRQLF